MESINLQIKPTLHCNCECIYCYAQGAKKSDMSDDLLEHIFREVGGFAKIRNISTVTVGWHGGEPLLAGPEFYRKVIELQRCYWDHLHVSHIMTSNMTLYRGGMREVLLELLAGNSRVVRISMDPIHPTRPFAGGKDSAEATMEGWLALKSDRLPMQAGYVVHKKSLDVVADVYNTFKNMGFTSLWVGPADNYFAPEHRDYSLPSEGWGLFLKELWEVWEDDEFGMMQISPLTEWRDAILSGVPIPNCQYGIPRGRTSVTFAISPDGALGPCGPLQDSGRFPIGNIRDMSMQDIAAHRLTYIITEKRENLLDECLKCEFVSLCGSGCLASHDETGKTTWCKGLKLFFEYLRSRGVLTDGNLQRSFENAEYIQRQIRNR